MSTNGSGVGLLGGMFLVFLTLKLFGYITWSWLWVTAPLWGVYAIVITFAIVVLIGAGLIDMVINIRRKIIQKRLKIKVMTMNLIKTVIVLIMLVMLMGCNRVVQTETTKHKHKNNFNVIDATSANGVQCVIAENLSGSSVSISCDWK